MSHDYIEEESFIVYSRINLNKERNSLLTEQAVQNFAKTAAFLLKANLTRREGDHGERKG